jgi:pyruvate formate lyase activating enzyme
MEARFYKRQKDNKIKCYLCPHECIIKPGHSGICKIRTNIGGTLNADMYGYLSATHFDPIEKKPLYHFHPGSEILSLGSLGCNFHCSCCQNYEISQTGKKGFPRLQEISVSSIVKAAKADPANIGVAYTYNEPTIWYEFMYDIARDIKDNGLKNVAVSNGYVSKDPLKQLVKYFDAFNIDIKSFDDTTHKRFTGGELKHVLQTLTTIVAEEKHLEITYLLVPGVNEDRQVFGNLLKWIEKQLGPEIPFHISRYFPRYRMTTTATPVTLIHEMAELASQYLRYVYTGNVSLDNFQNTVCPNCDALIIRREGFAVYPEGLGKDGSCMQCGYKIAVA